MADEQNVEVEVVEEEIVEEETQEEELEAEGEKDVESDESDDTEEKPEDKEEEDDVVVTIGDEEPEEKEEEAAPQWVKDLRREHRDLKKRNKQLELAAQSTPESTATVVGKEPAMDDDDIDYDADKFAVAMKSWLERKSLADNETKQLENAQEEQAKTWQTTLESYGTKKQELKVKDYDDAEEVVTDSLSELQQAVILQGAENPALVVYALGKNPGKAKELAKITDNVKFAFAIAKMETQLKVNKRKPSSKPEGKVMGGGSLSSSYEKTLEKLEAEADKTGDRTKVRNFKREHKNKK